MIANEKGSPLLICPSCGRQQTAGEHLCEKCGAPLTPHAHSDWVLGISARGFAAQQAVSGPPKLIVVIGVWLWMTPLLALGLFGTFGGLMGVMAGEPGLGLFISALGLGAVWLSGTILFRTTRNFFRGNRAVIAHSSIKTRRDEEEAEEIECLDCGQLIPAGTKQCPACGWSFSASD